MSDGRLIFDTSLDTTGFDRGYDKLKQAVDRLMIRVMAAGGEIQNSFSEALNGKGRISTAA